MKISKTEIGLIKSFINVETDDCISISFIMETILPYLREIGYRVFIEMLEETVSVVITDNKIKPQTHNYRGGNLIVKNDRHSDIRMGILETLVEFIKIYNEK